MTQMKRATAWSFSHWSVYDQCPRKYMRKFIDKVQEPPNAAMARGNAIHQKIDDYLKVGGRIPDEAISFASVIEDAREQGAFSEQKWAFTKDWKPTGYFDKRGPIWAPWLRVVLDAGILYPDGYAIALDWKTGKKYDDNLAQMELFATATMHRHPDMNTVETRLCYVDSGEDSVQVYKRAELPALTAQWEQRAHEMMNDPEYAPRPSFKCKWCFDSRANGGQCSAG